MYSKPNFNNLPQPVARGGPPQPYQQAYEEEEYEDDGPGGGGGGGPYTGMPQSLTEQQLKFLDAPDEVPDYLRDRLWGLFSRHSELSNIFDKNELERARRRVRLICRPMMWANSTPGKEGDISFLDRMQIEHFVDLMLRKSWMQQERRLLAPWLQEQVVKQDVRTTHGGGGNRGGFLSGAAGMIFGRGR